MVTFRPLRSLWIFWLAWITRCTYKPRSILVYFEINTVCHSIFYSDLTGSMSFSVNRSKIEPKKPSKKIGNLFSDAWKKGNEYDSKVKLILVFLDLCFVSELCNDGSLAHKPLAAIFLTSYYFSSCFCLNRIFLNPSHPIHPQRIVRELLRQIPWTQSLSP